MKTVNTLFGDVTITDIHMVRKQGYGQYNVEVSITFNGKEDIIRIHSSNSRLFDKLSDMDTQAERAAHLLDTLEYVIELAIENYTDHI